MFTPDILNLLLGTVVGGILKIVAKKMEMRRMEIEHMTQRQTLSDESADRAAKRVDRMGAWTRRTIALTVIGYLFVAPVLLMLFSKDTPIIYAYPESESGWLWFMTGPEKLRFIEAEGFTILPFQRQLAAMIAGFYFGAGAVK